MSALSELLHNSHTHLDSFARQCHSILEQSSSISGVRRVYTVKHRVKTYSQVRNKMMRGNLEHLISDPHLTLQDVVTHVPDLVGLRVVVLFSDDVERIYDAIRHNRGPTRSLEIMTDDKNKLLVDRYLYDTPFHKVKDDDSWAEARRKETGYTSLHLNCRIRRRDRLHDVFPALSCEVQLRTVLEEAWAETSHYLAYKRKVNKSVRDNLRQVMGQVTLLNERLLDTCRLAEHDARADEFKYSIQLTDSYKFDPSKDIGQLIVERLDLASRYANEREHKKAREVHKSLASREYADGLPKAIRKQVINVLRCELALDELYPSTPDAVNRARELYEKVLRKDPGHFWAKFRMSYILARQGETERAIDMCEAALASYKLRESRIRRWWDTEGLYADVMLYLGTCYWNLAEELFHRAFAANGEQIPKWHDAAVELRSKAIEKSEAAYEHIKQDKRQNKRNSKLIDRARNNLAYFYTQAEEYAEAWIRIKAIKDKTGNPFHLHTIGWCEFVRPGGSQEEALRCLNEACELLTLRTPDQASYGAAVMMQKHFIIAKSCIENGEQFEPDHVYWKWK